jgi:hypothetical protein
MKHLLFLTLLGIAVSTMAQQKPNTLSSKEKRDGWELLFDGKTTGGWHGFNKKNIGSAWKVKNGALYLDTTIKDGWQIKGGGDIVSEKEYGNFHLKLEWKIARNGNSGIMFYVQEKEQYGYPWLTGPEMQVLDNDGHPDGKIPKHRAGDLYDLIKSSSEPVKPVGSWNQAEIICDAGKLTFKLNGKTIVNTTLWNEEWATLVAGSKFREMPDFGKFRSGKIALQDHGNLVSYRNIKMRSW